MAIVYSGVVEFLSTLSLRRATRGYNICSNDPGISIHALLAESDSKNAAIGKPTLISIHALLAESDIVVPGPSIMIPISIHALLAESDRYFYNICRF